MKFKLPASPPGPSPPPPPSCTDLSRAAHTDLPGNDMKQFSALSEPACHASCCSTVGCAAYVYVTKMLNNYGACPENQSCCFLKYAAGHTGQCNPLKGDCLAVVLNVSVGPTYIGTAPASGIRSAVPLGENPLPPSLDPS